LAQFAKEIQRVAQAATGQNRPHAELARPRIIPHPVAGTIEFEHGQIVAKMGKRDWYTRRMIAQTKSPRLAKASPLDVAASTLAK
jgi:hypothetical protein